MAGLGPKIRVDHMLRERGEEATILRFLQHIPQERLNWWDALVFAQLSPPYTTSDSNMVQIEFVKGIHYRTTPVTLSLLRDGDSRIAQALEQRVRAAWEDDDRAIRGQLAPDEPAPLIYGWNG
jgi:hypothetical protein